MSDLKKLIESVNRLNEAQKHDFLDKIVAKYAKANMTLADVASLEKEARATRPPEGLMSGFITPEYRVRYALANAGEAIGTGGLFGSDGTVSYLDSTGEVKTARGDVGVAQQLAKKGLLSPEVAKRYNIKLTPPEGSDDSAAQPATPNDAQPAASDPLTKFVTTKVAADSVTTMSQFQADQLSKDLLNELRKLLNILNDSKLNFKSGIALSLIETDTLYERDLSGPEEEKLRTIIHNLKVLEPKTGPVVKALISNSLNRIPSKYSSTAPAAAPSATVVPGVQNDKAQASPAAGSTIASKKITWQDLAKLNPQIKNPNRIYPGQEIKLPNGSSAIVDQGDTLSSLAQRFNQGGYDSSDDEPVVTTDPAPASTTPASTAPASTAPASTAASLSNSQAAQVALEIKKGLAGSGLKPVDQNALDKTFMNIKSKADFDAVDSAFKRTSRKGIIDTVKSEWFYNKDKQFNPMLKRLGITAP